MNNPNSILESVLKKGVDQAEIFLSSTRALKIDVLNQEVESVDEIDETGCGIRIIKDKKLGFAYTSDFDETVLEDTINRAIENAKSSEPDEFNCLPNHPTAQPPNNLDLFDQILTKPSIKDKIDLALLIEKSAYKADNRVKKTEKVSYSDAEGEIWIVNSNGVSGSYKANYCGGAAEVIAVSGQEMEAGFGLSYVKKIADFNPEAVGLEAAQKAAERLGAKPIPSQKIPLVLDPHVGTDILGVLAAALSSDSVQKGKSLFINKLGQAVGSNLLTIIDDGRLPNGIDSAPFDAEGVPTQETKLIENGKLNTYLFNTYTAKKGKTQSTGNAVRGSFAGTPSVGATNYYIKAGDKPADSIIKSINKGLYITRVMGIHTANPISGDFSVGATGIMIENGQKTFPVKGITIAGNLIDLLKAIESIGSDLRFITNVGSPTLLVSGITVSGT